VDPNPVFDSKIFILILVIVSILVATFFAFFGMGTKSTWLDGDRKGILLSFPLRKTKDLRGSFYNKVIVYQK
jgi:hypothetical protein